MPNKKENIIALLAGNIAPFEKLKEDLQDLEIFDETGICDTSFLLSALQYANKYLNVCRDLVLVINDKLASGLPVTESETKKKEDNGATWSPEKILQNCTLKDNVLYLPNVQFNKNTYLKAKTWIEEAGGQWDIKKKGFTFEFNADRVFAILHEGKRCNLQQDFQYFATPDAIADLAVSKFSTLTADMKILEPSAGRGSLVKAVRRRCPDAVVDCFELMPENVQFLSKVDGANIIGEDFTVDSHGEYDRIIANPPFANNQDIDHVYMMFDRLKPGGELSVIVSKRWTFDNQSKCVKFRQWLEENEVELTDIAGGEFKESGTTVSTCLLFIKKQFEKNMTTQTRLDLF